MDNKKRIKIKKNLKVSGIICLILGLLMMIAGFLLDYKDTNVIEIDSGKIVSTELKKVETEFEYYTDTVTQLWLEIDSKQRKYLTILPIFVNRYDEIKSGDSVLIWCKKDQLNRGFYRIYQLKKYDKVIMEFNEMIKSEGNTKNTVIGICLFLIFIGILLIVLGYLIWSKFEKGT